MSENSRLSVANKPGAEPAENRSSNDVVLISVGEAAAETEVTGSKSSVQSATLNANVNEPMHNAMVPDNEKPRTLDGTLPAFLVT